MDHAPTQKPFYRSLYASGSEADEPEAELDRRTAHMPVASAREVPHLFTTKETST